MQETSPRPESSRLKLTPFEEYMYFDDRPEYPMTGFFRLRFSGKLDFAAMSAAVQTTVARHPLVRSIIHRDRKHGNCWSDHGVLPIVLERWNADLQGEYPLASHLDLTQTAGTRIWLVDRMGASDLVAQIHHACTDALGMCQFIEDLLIIYAGNMGELGSDVVLRPIDNQRLPFRNQFGLTWRKLLGLIPRQMLGLHVIGKFFIRKAAPLVLLSGNQPVDHPTPFPSPCAIDFDRDITSLILTEARKRRMTVNDLLARDLFLAIHEWRRQNGVSLGNNEWLRFFVPINHRTPEDQSLSAANVMSAVFLERNCEQLNDPELLLQSIHAQMQKIKRHQLGFLFIAAHALMSRLPFLRNHAIRRGECVSSCVFSNLGVILNRTPLPRQDGKLTIGDILLDGVDFIAPLRPLTAVAFCACSYAGRLSVNLHFDPRSISKSQADQLLEIFVRQVADSVKVPAQESMPAFP